MYILVFAIMWVGQPRGADMETIGYFPTRDECAEAFETIAKLSNNPFTIQGTCVFVPKPKDR